MYSQRPVPDSSLRSTSIDGGGGSGHQSIVSSGSDATLVAKNPKEFAQRKPQVPPSRRVDDGDTEVSLTIGSRDLEKISFNDRRDFGSNIEASPTRSNKAEQKYASPQKQARSHMGDSNSSTPKSCSPRRLPRSSTQIESMRNHGLLRGESTRSFLSASSYRSGHSRTASIGSFASRSTTSPRRQLNRAESNKSFSSELDHYFVSLKTSSVSGSCDGNGTVATNSSNGSKVARTPTPPDLLRNVTQSSARRMIVQQQQGAQKARRGGGASIASCASTKFRHADTSPVWRPDNPVATQLRYQISSASSRSGVLMTNSHQEGDTGVVVEMNAPLGVSDPSLDRQLFYPTTGATSPDMLHDSNGDIQWNPSSSNFVQFRRASM